MILKQKINKIVKISDLFSKLDIKNVENACYSVPFPLFVNGPKGYNKIVTAFRTELQPSMEVALSNGKLITTSLKHKFLVNGEWKFSGDLKVGDIIQSNDVNNPVYVVNTNTKAENEILYDISVENVHCYYSDGVVSHNSWLLTRIGANAMIQGKNVMHFTLELNESYVGLRYDCCFSKINFQQIRNNKEKIANLMESIPGELNVKYYPVKTVSAQSLKYYIDRYVTLTGKKVDLVIVDYADLLKPIEADKNGSSYQDSGGIYEELRMIAGELGVPILTVSQTNRGGATEDIVQAHNIADSYKKIMTADFVFSLMRNLDDKANNTAKIHIIKNRFGPDGMTLYSKFNSGNGDISIYDDKAPEYIEIQQLANQSASNAKKFLKSKWDEINATKAGLDRET